MATIIFDFDGTIADSFDFVIDFLIKNSKVKKLTPSGRKELRGLPMTRVASRMGHRRHKQIGLFFSGRRHMGKSIDGVRPIAGMPEVIKKLAGDGHKLLILTNNSPVNVDRFLRRYGLRQHFAGIHGNAWVLGKRVALVRIAARHHSRVLYIGDELRDVRAAKAVSTRIVAVTWGFSTKEKLIATRPHSLAHRPADILKFVNKK